MESEERGLSGRGIEDIMWGGNTVETKVPVARSCRFPTTHLGLASTAQLSWTLPREGGGETGGAFRRQKEEMGRMRCPLQVFVGPLVAYICPYIKHDMSAVVNWYS